MNNNEDLNKKIKQITDILGQENLPDNIKGLLSLLAAPAASSGESQPPKTNENPAFKEDKSARTEFEESVEMAAKVKKIMERLNTHNDPKINLLMALRPFMGDKRQKKINNCISLLRFSSLARLAEEQEKGIL